MLIWLLLDDGTTNADAQAVPKARAAAKTSAVFAAAEFGEVVVVVVVVVVVDERMQLMHRLPLLDQVKKFPMEFIFVIVWLKGRYSNGEQTIDYPWRLPAYYHSVVVVVSRIEVTEGCTCYSCRFFMLDFFLLEIFYETFCIICKQVSDFI